MTPEEVAAYPSDINDIEGAVKLADCMAKVQNYGRYYVIYTKEI
jgi:hypothetical protein